MGLLDLFGSSKKSVSDNEFSDVRSRLYGKGFSDTQINDVKKIFRGDMAESTESGIDTAEIKKGIEWMKKNMGSHSLSAEKIGILEKELNEEL